MWGALKHKYMMGANTHSRDVMSIAMENNSKVIRGDQRSSQARGCRGLRDKGCLPSRTSGADVSKTAKSNGAVAVAITSVDAQHTTYQTGTIFELSDRVMLLLLQRLTKRNTREGDEKIFQVLMELIRTPVYLLVEEGFERPAELLDIVVGALDSDRRGRGK